MNVTTAVHAPVRRSNRSEEHTSELQSLTNIVCRLLLEKKSIKVGVHTPHIEREHVLVDILLCLADPRKHTIKPSTQRCQLRDRPHLVACSAQCAEAHA